MAITDTDLKTTKAGTGRYISAKCEVIEGPFKGRVLYANFNIQNPSDKAQQIGQAQLKEALKALGKNNVTDTEEMHNIPFVASVKVTGNESDQYGLKNEIAKFSKYANNGISAPQSGPAPVKTSGNPWE